MHKTQKKHSATHKLHSCEIKGKTAGKCAASENEINFYIKKRRITAPVPVL